MAEEKESFKYEGELSCCFDEVTKIISLSDTTQKLTFTEYPDREWDSYEIFYTSSNENVVKVGENGELTPVGLGKATITVTLAVGELFYEEITVPGGFVETVGVSYGKTANETIDILVVEDTDTYVPKIVDEGSSNNVHWTLDELGHMEIWGTGDVEYLKNYLGEWSSTWNSDFNKLKVKSVKMAVEGMTRWDRMFQEFDSLKTVDLTECDMSELVSMQLMFYHCDVLSKVLFPEDANTEKLTNMEGIFCCCFKLPYVDISMLDTKSVTTMACLFQHCWVLSDVNLENLDTSNVMYMDYMFFQCESLMKVDVSKFNTAKVIDMSNMFGGLYSVKSLDLSSFDTKNVESMRGMFSEMKSMTTLDLSTFDTSNVVDMAGMFSGMYRLESLDLTQLETSNAVNMSSMFAGLKLTEPLDYSALDTGKVTTMAGMFADFGAYGSELEFPGLDTSNVEDMSLMFAMGDRGEYDEHSSQLKELDVSGFDTSNVTTMSCMFGGCSGLTTLDVSGFDVGKCRDFRGMFSGCYGLTGLDVSGFIAEEADGWYMFENCAGLTTLDLSGIKSVSRVTNMFAGCTKLQSLDLKHVDVSKLDNTEEMFRNCKSLQSVDLSGWNVENVFSMTRMFDGCHSLVTIQGMDGWYLKLLVNSKEMFKDCYALTTTITLSNCPSSYEDMLLNTSTAKGSSFILDYQKGCSKAMIDRLLVMAATGANVAAGERLDEEVDLTIPETVSGSAVKYSGVVNNMVWTVNEEGLLTVDGVGDLPVYCFITQGTIYENVTLAPPWTAYADEITGAVFNVKGMTRTDYLFDGMGKMTFVDLSGWEEENVVFMDYMFKKCNALSSLDFSNRNFENVVSMKYFLQNCWNLRTLDLTNINTPELKSGAYLFASCAVQYLDVSDLDIENMDVFTGMFHRCYYTEKITLGDWDTSHIYDMSGMFFECEWMSEVNLDVLDTQNVTSMGSMFQLNWHMTDIDVSAFDTGEVRDFRNMFYGCTALETLDISGFDTTNGEYYSQMFWNCQKVKTLDVSNFKTGKCAVFYGMFTQTYEVKKLDVSKWDMSSAVTLDYMFENSGIEFLDTSNWNMPNVESMVETFAFCENLSMEFKLPNATADYLMLFYGSGQKDWHQNGNLIIVDASNVDYERAKSVVGMSGVILKDGLGDANLDGDVDALDALKVLKQSAGIEAFHPGDCWLIPYDVNLDGDIDALDALDILKFVAGMIEKPMPVLPDKSAG